MTKITESTIEKFAIELLENQGYQYIYAPSIALDMSACDAQVGATHQQGNTMKNNLPDKQSNFLLYTGNDGKVNVEVFLKDETVWLTQKAIGELFGIERSVITKHLKNIFSSGKLYKESNVQKMHFGYSDKPIKFYNLDAINVPPISKHPANIYETGELRKEPTISILETVQKEGELQIASTVRKFRTVEAEG